MTNNFYVIDASSLIELNKNTPLDIFPSAWGILSELIRKKILVAPKEVLKEIDDKDGKLRAWVKHQKNFFKDPTQKQLDIVKEIVTKYPSIVKPNKKTSADPFVIALAIDMATNDQTTLVQVKRIVVTEERIKGERITIPYICNKYNIESVNILNMLRLEKITI